MAKIFTNEVGKKIKLHFDGEDISDASLVKIMYKKPDNTTGEWVGSVEGKSTITYDTQAGDLDQAGEWDFRGYIEVGNFKGYSERETITVEDSSL